MIYDYFVNSFQIFLIVLVRLIGLFTTAPFFSGTNFPWRMRLGFGFFVTLIAVPLVIGWGIEAPAALPDFGVRLISNFVTGAGIGFFIYLIITAFQVSAQVFSIPMGLGMNEVMDPLSQTQVPAVGNLLGVMILLLILRVDGQFYMVKLIVESFYRVDLLLIESTEVIAKGLLSGVLVMFDIAIKISLPIVAITLMLDVAMGMISRVAPQFNVMIMGFNIKILGGFIILWLILPALVNLGSEMVTQVMDSAEVLIEYMGAS